MSEQAPVVERIETEGTIVGIDGPPELLETARLGLPDGAALAEAIAARLRRTGVDVLERRRPAPAGRELVALADRRGRSSVELLRADRTLVTEIEAGAWFAGSPRRRFARRLLVRMPRILRPRRLAPDVAFWTGVRAAA